jgi:hypothetical protein
LSFLQCYLSTTNSSVSSRQEKSYKQKNIARYEKDVSFEKYIELFAGSRLCCGVIHPMGVNIGLRINSPETKISLDNANLSAMWVKP